MRLGLSREEFLGSTLRMIAALHAEWTAERREHLTMVALMWRDFINFSFARPKEPVTLNDLLPPDQIDEAEPTRMTPRRRQEIAERIRRQMRGLPGLVVKKADGSDG